LNIAKNLRRSRGPIGVTFKDCARTHLKKRGNAVGQSRSGCKGGTAKQSRVGQQGVSKQIGEENHIIQEGSECREEELSEKTVKTVIVEAACETGPPCRPGRKGTSNLPHTVFRNKPLPTEQTENSVSN